jgi:hypothetical protein
MKLGRWMDVFPGIAAAIDGLINVTNRKERWKWRINGSIAGMRFRTA